MLVFGKDVRQNIHDGIKQCYDDAIANGHTDMEVSQARGTFNNLKARLDSVDNKILNNENLANKINLIDVPSQKLVENDDLNNFTETGTFLSTEGAITNSLLNKPENLTVAFKMIVSYINLSTRVLQIIISNDSTPKIFIRKGHGEQWSPWQQLVLDNQLENYIPVVNAVDKMTDTSKIYGNSGDGKIYKYSSDAEKFIPADTVAVITTTVTFKDTQNEATCTANIVSWGKIISVFFSVTIPSSTTLVFATGAVIPSTNRPPYAVQANCAMPDCVLTINTDGRVVGVATNDLEEESKTLTFSCTYVKK